MQQRVGALTQSDRLTCWEGSSHVLCLHNNTALQAERCARTTPVATNAHCLFDSCRLGQASATSCPTLTVCARPHSSRPRSDMLQIAEIAVADSRGSWRKVSQIPHVEAVGMLNARHAAQLVRPVLCETCLRWTRPKRSSAAELPCTLLGLALF